MRDFRGEIVRAYEDAGWRFTPRSAFGALAVFQRANEIAAPSAQQILKDSALLLVWLTTQSPPAGDNATLAGGLFTVFREGFARSL